MPGKSLVEKYQASKFVTIVEVMSEDVTDEGIKKIHHYKLLPVEQVKGSINKEFIVNVEEPYTSCSGPEKTGKKWLLFHNGEDEIYLGGCTPHKRLEFLERTNPNWRWLFDNADKDENFFKEEQNKRIKIVKELLAHESVKSLTDASGRITLHRVSEKAFREFNHLLKNHDVAMYSLINEEIEQTMDEKFFKSNYQQASLQIFFLHSFTYNELVELKEIINTSIGKKFFKHYASMNEDFVTNSNTMANAYYPYVRARINARLKEKATKSK